jgi:hypothetical protein
MFDENLKRVGVFNHFIQTGLFSSIFTFTSNIGGIRIILESSLQAILFPLAIAPDAIASLLALLSFTRAKNKNLGKTFDLVYIPTKTALVFTAVFAGISLVAVHSLFLIAVGSGLLYHTALSVYNLYKCLKTPKNSPISLNLRNLYKENAIRNGVSSLVGGIVIVGILMTMVFAPYLGATMLAIAGIGTAAMLLLTSAYALYRHFRQSITQTIANEKIPSYTIPLLDQPINSKAYYYRKFRAEYLTGNLEQDEQFLANEIYQKKAVLFNKINSSRGKASEFFWPENPKRQAKINYLNKLISHAPSLDLEKVGPQEIVAHPIALQKLFNSPSKAVFQSFFRYVGDLEDITEAVKKYVEIYSATAEAGLLDELSTSGASTYVYG